MTIVAVVAVPTVVNDRVLDPDLDLDLVHDVSVLRAGDGRLPDVADHLHGDEDDQTHAAVEVAWDELS
jgi:hypothetical protein